MPLVPKPDSRGFQGFTYLCWFQKHSPSERVVRTVGQAEEDTGLRLGTSFAYLAQLKVAEQLGPKRSRESGYRLLPGIGGLNEFLSELTAAKVATALGIEESRVRGWKVGGGGGEIATTIPPVAATKNQQPSLPLETGSPAPKPALISIDEVEMTLRSVVSPLIQRIAHIEDRQIAFAKQLDRIESRGAVASTSGAPGLESALVSMIALLRDLPDRLVAEQTEKLLNVLDESGKHTGRTLRSLREGLEFQNREIVAVLAKVSDSLTKLLAGKDATLMSLAQALNNALSLVPEEDAPAVPVARTALPAVTVPSNGNGNGSGN